MFLHGYLADKNSFGFQVPFFEKNFEVHTFDLKGFGSNTDMPYPYSLDDYVLEVKEYMYKHSLKKPNVIAHSFGGRIAIKSLAMDSGLFDKIVLTGSAGLKPKRSIKYRLKKLEFSVLKKFIKKEKLLRFYSSDYLALNEVMRKSFKMIVEEHLDNLLSEIKNECLIINGVLDRETPVYMAKRLNRGITNSRLVLLEDAGHFCFIDKPYKFNMEVNEFLLN